MFMAHSRDGKGEEEAVQDDQRKQGCGSMFLFGFLGK